MTYRYDHEERRRQIAVLLSYPKVGPLSAAAIAINLGTSEDQIQAALESLVREGRIVQTNDGRFVSAPRLSSGRSTAPEHAGHHRTGPKRRVRG